MEDEILKDLRVLDLTRIVAGPYATRILADFGAEVIKVQTHRLAVGIEADRSPYFAAWNRNKRSICLNLDHVEARKLFLKLVAISDIVVENFSPRVMSNWGLHYDALKDANDILIMLSMSAMGQTGPWKDFVAYGPTIQSLGGHTGLTSYGQDTPMGLGYAYADVVSGIYGAMSILAALENRHRTGRGQYIDLSEYEAACTLIGPALMSASVDREKSFSGANSGESGQAAPYGCYRCAGEDRWCVIAAFTEGEWNALRSALGDPAWAREKRFSSFSGRQKFSEELDRLIGEWTAALSAEQVVDLLHEADVPSGIVQNAEDLANDPQLWANDFFTTMEHPVLGSMRTDTFPVKFKRLPKRAFKASPLLGEANRYVYGDLLGMSEASIQANIDAGIIA